MQSLCLDLSCGCCRQRSISLVYALTKYCTGARASLNCMFVNVKISSRTPPGSCGLASRILDRHQRHSHEVCARPDVELMAALQFISYDFFRLHRPTICTDEGQPGPLFYAVQSAQLLGMINVNVFAEALIYLHLLAKRLSASSNGAWILNLCLVFCFVWKSSNTTVSRGAHSACPW